MGKTSITKFQANNVKNSNDKQFAQRVYDDMHLSQDDKKSTNEACTSMTIK